MEWHFTNGSIHSTDKTTFIPIGPNNLHEKFVFGMNPNCFVFQSQFTLDINACAVCTDFNIIQPNDLYNKNICINYSTKWNKCVTIIRINNKIKAKTGSNNQYTERGVGMRTNE